MAQAASQTLFRPDTAADALAARLRARLLEGDFAPGETISIRRVAAAEGVSVIPARDALRGLVAEGALEFRDARTIAVPAPCASTIGEMRHARLAIEGELAWRAWDNLRDAGVALARIDETVTQGLVARDAPAYMRANQAFHFFVYHRAEAPVLLALAERLWLLFAPGMRIVCEALDGRLPQTDHHRAALAALGAGDRQAFRAAFEADIAQGMDTLLGQIRRAPVPAPQRGET